MEKYFKKCLLLVLIFVLVMTSGCVKEGSAEIYLSDNSNASLPKDLLSPKNPPDQHPINKGNPDFSKVTFKAIWISYYELPFLNKSKKDAEEEFANMLKTLKGQGYTAVFCHVRANADAFYPSKYFPFSVQLTGKAGGNPGYDPLEIMIRTAKNQGLEFHAWINPYRVSGSNNNPKDLAEGHIAAKWLADKSGRAVISGKGIYFNPSSPDVQRLILNSIGEILENYKVDGIHFDDYFYPPSLTEDFDKKDYDAYKKSAKKPLSLGDWRRANVNALVSAVYRLCHSHNVLFGISPAANISFDNSHHNYTGLYADTALWMRCEGYIDYILPQLYFGYKHPNEKSRYDYLLNIWASLPKHKNLKFYVGLGAYRMDEEVDDKAEWHNDNTLMARQTKDAILKGATGIAVFSYTASSSQKPHNSLQIKNMFKVFN